MSRIIIIARRGAVCCLSVVLVSGVVGCKSTSSRLAGVPGLGWLGDDTADAAAQLASELPAPSSVASPEPLRTDDDSPTHSVTATTHGNSGHDSPDKRYPTTQYPDIAAAGSAVRTASATGDVRPGYQTGPYDVAAPQTMTAANAMSGARSGADGATGSAAGPSGGPSVAGGQGYSTTAPPTATMSTAPPRAGQTTWQSEPAAMATNQGAPNQASAASGSTLPSDRDTWSNDGSAAPNRFDAESLDAGATNGPATLDNSRSSGWESTPTGPAATGSGASPAGYGQSEPSHAGPEGQLVTHSEPAADTPAENRPTHPAAADARPASVYQSPTASEQSGWRPGSTTTFIPSSVPAASASYEE